MEITALDIYWVTALDSIREALHVLTLCFGLVGAVGLILYGISGGEVKMGGRFAAWLLPVAAVLLLAQAFIPSTRAAAAMVVLPAIVNSEAVQTLPTELTTLAKEWMQELRPAKKEKQNANR